MKQSKEWLSFDGQLDKLVARGCIVSDRDAAIAALKRVNYYRLTAYLLPFRKQGIDAYKKDTTFERIYAIYEFDRKMRTILFAAIEEIETFLRTQFSYYHAAKYTPLGYLSPKNFRDNCKHNTFIERFEREVERNNSLLFVKHHKENYNGNFPLWVAVELFSFGTISRFYSDLKTSDQKTLSKTLYPEISLNNTVLSSWFRCLTDLRNTCAHYGRLYYRTFPAVPKTPHMKVTGNNVFKAPLGVRLFDMIFILQFLYPKPLAWQSEVLEPIIALLDRYEAHVDLRHIGFPSDWEAQLRNHPTYR